MRYVGRSAALALAILAMPVCWPVRPAAAQARDLRTFDACSLLTTADVESAVDAVRQAEGRSTGSRYVVDATKEGPGGVLPTADCKFVLKPKDPNGYTGAIGIHVEPGDGFTFYKNQGKSVDGFGDEAVRVGSSLIVRAGDLMLSIGEDPFGTSDLPDEILRRAAVRAKSMPPS